MRHVRLIAKADEYDTSPGLVVLAAIASPWAELPDGFSADRDGVLIAHDITEHCNGAANMGPVWDELEAIGALYNVRGQWGTLATDRPDYHPPEWHMAHDLARMFEDWQCMDNCAIGPNSMRTKPTDMDEIFLDVIAHAKEIEKKETEYRGDETDNLEELRAQYYDMCLHRLRSGYRKSCRRFGTGFAGLNQFSAIREAIKDVLREVEHEGQQFRLSYGNGSATCEPIYDEAY